MKSLRPLFLCAALALSCTTFAADEEGKKEKDMFRLGDRLKLTLPVNVPALESPVTIVGLGKKDWVLLEYDRTFSKPGESGLKTEKRQIWVNFAQVIAAEKVSAPAIKEE